VLVYPAWFGLAGPQAVTGVLFALAPFSGVPLSGLLAPGHYVSPANAYVRFGGYLGRIGPPPDFVGAGAGLAAFASAVVARRRPLTWLLVFMTLATLLFALGPYLIGGTPVASHLWLPWRGLAKFPLLKEILPDQFAPFIALFLGLLLALGLDALYREHLRPAARHASAMAMAVTGLVALLVLVPVFATFDMPLRVVRVSVPAYMRQDAPRLPDGSVLLTVPFPITGTTQPMLWQAMDGLRFRLAGAALKTPNKEGGPVARGAPGSARRILTSLSVPGPPEPQATPSELAAIRYAVRAWHVDEVVIDGASRDPRYASGFLTMALGAAPSYVDGAWVWRVPYRAPLAAPVFGVSLAQCRAAAAAPEFRTEPLFTARCVLILAGRI
jgi:hypothetical protein